MQGIGPGFEEMLMKITLFGQQHSTALTVTYDVLSNGKMNVLACLHCGVTAMVLLQPIPSAYRRQLLPCRAAAVPRLENVGRHSRGGPEHLHLWSTPSRPTETKPSSGPLLSTQRG